MFDLILRGATVVNASGMQRADVAITAGRIAALFPVHAGAAETVRYGDLARGSKHAGKTDDDRAIEHADGEPEGEPDAALPMPGTSELSGIAIRELDLTGCLLLPGLIDAHVHLCEPGLTQKEDFASGTRAAIAGGVTTLLDMPTDNPWTVDAQQWREKRDLARGNLFADVGLQVAIPRDGLSAQALVEVGSLGPASFEIFCATGLAAFCHDTQNDLVRSLRSLRGLPSMACVSPGDLSIMQAADMANVPGDVDLGEDGVFASDVTHFLAGRPPVAEATGVARAILAAAAVDIPLHLRQVNSALGLATLARLRDLANVTVEATPQALYFTSDDYVRYGNSLKAAPPMRRAADVAALREAVRTGLIDMLVSDHAPHTPEEKNGPGITFGKAPMGVPGVQTMLFSVLALVASNDLDMMSLVRLCSFNPARRFGLGTQKGVIGVGFDADLLVLDPRGITTVRHAEQRSKSAYTPFDGLQVPWRLDKVFLRGRQVCDANGPIDTVMSGQVLSCSRH